VAWRNAGAPSEQRIDFRIGINVGEPRSVEKQIPIQ
jgi:hypothetical protein